MRSTNYTLSPTRINNAKAKVKPYKLSDGGGLLINVSASGLKTWRYQYRFGGTRCDLKASVYIVLALGMFGVFTLQLPARLREKLDGASRSQRGEGGAPSPAPAAYAVHMGTESVAETVCGGYWRPDRYLRAALRARCGPTP